MELDETYEISQILFRKRGGMATAEESKRLEEWMEHNADNAALYERVMSGESMKSRIELETKINVGQGYLRLMKRLKTRRQVQKRKIIFAIAASVLIVMGVGILIHKTIPTEEPRVIVAETEILPGTQKAWLLLDNGQKVDLEKTDKEKLSNGAVNKEGILTYASGDVEKVSAVNTLVVPVKGEYQLVLEDGTRVWLNSDSRLNYPVVFVGDQRIVELEGEAYFEVARDPNRPFMVKSGKLQTRVLGTIFNISAYPEDKRNCVTLLTGSVIVGVHENEPIQLLPGEQLQFMQNTGDTQVHQIEPQEVIAWKNGLFFFKNRELKEIIPQLERWYGVNVHCESEELEQLKFFIRTRRYENIETILNILKLTGYLEYSITDNVVLLKRKAYSRK